MPPTRTTQARFCEKQEEAKQALAEAKVAEAEAQKALKDTIAANFSPLTEKQFITIGRPYWDYLYEHDLFSSLTLLM
jgi:hypothetical protein